jgi:hypothetical protein
VLTGTSQSHPVFSARLRKEIYRPLQLIARVLSFALDLHRLAVGNNLLHGHTRKLVERVELLPHETLLVEVGVDDLPGGVVPPLVISGDVDFLLGCRKFGGAKEP